MTGWNGLSCKNAGSAGFPLELGGCGHATGDYGDIPG
jgi:hypothetical protein